MDEQLDTAVSWFLRAILLTTSSSLKKGKWAESEAILNNGAKAVTIRYCGASRDDGSGSGRRENKENRPDHTPRLGLTPARPRLG